MCLWHAIDVPGPLSSEHFHPLPPKPYSHYDRKMNIYRNILRVGYGIPFDDETRARWTEFFMLMRAADNYLDEENEASLEERMKTFVDFCLEDKAGQYYPHLAYDHLGADISAQLMINTIDVLAFNYKAKQATSPLRLAAARTLEGRATARLLEALASADMKAHPKFARFSTHLEYAGSITSIGNSAIGLRQDAKRGETALPYTLRNQEALFALQALSIYRIAKKHIRPEIGD